MTPPTKFALMRANRAITSKFAYARFKQEEAGRLIARQIDENVRAMSLNFRPPHPHLLSTPWVDLQARQR